MSFRIGIQYNNGTVKEYNGIPAFKQDDSKLTLLLERKQNSFGVMIDTCLIIIPFCSVQEVIVECDV